MSLRTTISIMRPLASSIASSSLQPISAASNCTQIQHRTCTSQATTTTDVKPRRRDTWLIQDWSLMQGEYPDAGFGADRAELEQNPEIEEKLYSGTNHLVKRKGHYRLRHSLETQIRYMKSDAYEQAYKGMPIFFWYRRNQKGQFPYWRAPKMFCLWSDFKYKVNNPCPICRDEYLWFDFRNPSLLRMFMVPGTLHRIGHHRSGLCQEQYERLKVEIGRAVDTGYMTFSVPDRVYDYRLYYDDWKQPPPQAHVKAPTKLSTKVCNRCLANHSNLSERSGPFERPRTDSKVVYPAINVDVKPSFDPWWTRWDEFARKLH